jgi:hypothetical protein
MPIRNECQSLFYWVNFLLNLLYYLSYSPIKDVLLHPLKDNDAYNITNTSVVGEG